MIKKIVPSTDKNLRKKSKPVKKVDRKIKNIAKDLIDTLKVQKDPEGVGLAAPQIGKNIRMFAMVDDGKGIKIVINPKIISVDKKYKPKSKEKSLEGCLSIPYYYGPLKRPQKVTIEYQNLKGQKKQETFKGFSAQIVQHEIDHLNGVLFVDHLIENNQSLFKLNDDNEWEEVELI